MYKEGGSGGDSPPAYAVPLSPPKARAKPFSLIAHIIYIGNFNPTPHLQLIMISNLVELDLSIYLEKSGN